MPKRILHPDLRALQEAHDTIMNNLTRPMPPVITLASNACMSLSKFRKLFQQTYGQSVYDYHLKARLAYAKELLFGNEFTITQIAYKVGFSHHQSFIKTFIKHTGITPNEFRQLNADINSNKQSYSTLAN